MWTRLGQRAPLILLWYMDKVIYMYLLFQFLYFKQLTHKSIFCCRCCVGGWERPSSAVLGRKYWWVELGGST